MPGPGYWDYDENGDPIWVDLPPDEGGGVKEPTTTGDVQVYPGESWDTIMPPGGSWGTPPAALTPAAQQRAVANANQRDYLAKKQAYEAAVAQSQTPENYDGDIDALKASMDVARRDWVTESAKADSLEKQEAAAEKPTATPWSTPQRAPDGTIYQVNRVTGEMRIVGNVSPTGGAAAPRPSPLAANTSARYNAVMMPDGTIQYQENKNYIPPEQTKAAWLSSTPTTRFLLRQNADGEIERVENPNYMDPETDPQIQWAKKQQAWDNAYKQLTAQINAQNNLQSQWNEMVPRAAMPGQVYYSGYEPNGIMSQIFGNMGMGYDPEKYRAPILQFDPAQSWAQAQQLIAQQQGGR